MRSWRRHLPHAPVRHAARPVRRRGKPCPQSSTVTLSCEFTPAVGRPALNKTSLTVMAGLVPRLSGGVLPIFRLAPIRLTLAAPPLNMIGEQVPVMQWSHWEQQVAASHVLHDGLGTAELTELREYQAQPLP